MHPPVVGPAQRMLIVARRRRAAGTENEDQSACSTVESRWRSEDVVPQEGIDRLLHERSDSVSSADVASSRMRIGGSTSRARAMAMRWRCPPDSRAPRSPSTVSYPSGKRVMNSCAFAARAAASI